MIDASEIECAYRNEANVDAFRARMDPVYEDFKAKHGAELLEAVQNTN